MTSSNPSSSTSSSPSNPSSSPPRPRCVVQESSVPWQTLADRMESPTEPLRDAASVAHVYRYRRRMLGQATGGRELGCSLMEVEPGGYTAFPYHAHAISEEAIYILGGEGVMRMPKGDFSVGVGDYIALLPGEDGAHQLWNFHPHHTLRYLCVGTMGKHEAVIYPDSGKLLVKSDCIRGGIYLRDQAVHYMYGEGKVYTPESQPSPAVPHN